MTELAVMGISCFLLGLFIGWGLGPCAEFRLWMTDRRPRP